MYDKIIEVVYEISYLGVTIESTGGWNKYKTKKNLKVNYPLLTPDV
jgi:hypothetical protein